MLVGDNTKNTMNLAKFENHPLMEWRVWEEVGKLNPIAGHTLVSAAAKALLLPEDILMDSEQNYLNNFAHTLSLYTLDKKFEFFIETKNTEQLSKYFENNGRIIKRLINNNPNIISQIPWIDLFNFARENGLVEIQIVSLYIAPKCLLETENLEILENIEVLLKTGCGVNVERSLKDQIGPFSWDSCFNLAANNHLKKLSRAILGASPDFAIERSTLIKNGWKSLVASFFTHALIVLIVAGLIFLTVFCMPIIPHIIFVPLSMLTVVWTLSTILLLIEEARNIVDSKFDYLRHALVRPYR